MRTLALAIVGLAVLACMSPSARHDASTATIPPAVAHAAKNVWRLDVATQRSWTDDDGVEVSVIGTSHATAFPVQQIGEEIILMTARHAVDGDVRSIAARSGIRFLTGGRVLQLHQRVDAALVAFKTDMEIELHEIDRRVPEFGEIVYAAGYPGNMGRLFLGLGVISDPDINTISVYPGSSGSPVFGADGRVVAMVHRIGVHHDRPISHTCFTVLMRNL